MCKQSLKALLVAFVLQLVFWILLANFLWLPVWECPSALLQLNVQSSVSTVRVFFLLETLLAIWPFDLNCSVLQYAIASQFDISPFNVTVHIKVSIWVKFQKTSETSKTFENNIIIVSCNTISKNQNLKNYPLTWKHGNEAKNIISLRHKLILRFLIVNKRKQTEDRIINISVAFIFWKPTFFPWLLE